MLAALGLGLGSSAAWAGLYDVSSWGPVAIVVLAGALAVIVAAPARLEAPALLLLGGLAALAALGALSMGWAQSPPAAAIEAHRWALYAACFVIAATLTRTPRARLVLLGAVTAGALAVDLVLVVQLVGSGAPSRFVANRLNLPMGYVNGQAAALAFGVWPALAVAERSPRVVLRGVGAALVTLLVGLMLLTQSRGGLMALGVTAVALLVLFPGRLRRAWLLLVAGGFVSVAGAELTDVYSLAEPGQLRPDATVVNDAVVILLCASVGAGLVWAAATALVDRSSASARAKATAGVAALAMASLAVSGAAVVALGNPVGRLHDQVDQFTRLDTSSATSGSRLLSGGGNRYDYWRVAVEEFGAHPVAGLGAGNFVSEYFARRRTEEDVRQPHSLALQQLAELGVLGGTAALALLVAAAWLVLEAARRAAREAGESSAGVAVAASGVLIAWTTHTSVDWLHLLPGLTGAALCAAACLSRSRDPRSPADRRRRLALVAASGLAICVAGSGIGRLTLASHERARARTALEEGDPRRAIELAAQSLELQPQELTVLYTQAAAWARLDDYPRARGTLRRASRLEPTNPIPKALLGDLALRRGDLRVSRAEYAAAVRRDPQNRTLREALAAVDAAARGGVR